MRSPSLTAIFLDSGTGHLSVGIVEVTFALDFAAGNTTLSFADHTSFPSAWMVPTLVLVAPPLRIEYTSKANWNSWFASNLSVLMVVPLMLRSPIFFMALKSSVPNPALPGYFDFLKTVDSEL